MNNLAVVRHNEAAIAAAPNHAANWNLSDTMELGRVLASSGYFRDVRDASQAVAKILFGREIGIGPMTALMSIYVVEGKPAPSANLIAARVKSSGRYDYRVREHSAERCRVEFFERGGKEGWDSLGTIEWNMEDARRAGLGGRGPWKSYPRAMLFARAISEGARVHCPELFGGAPVYTPEELGAEVDGEGNLIVPPPTADMLGNGQHPRESEGATPAQVELIERMIGSHVLTEKEVKGIQRRLQNGMTRGAATDAIDWLKETIDVREEAERQEAATMAEYETEAEMDRLTEELPF